MPATPRGGNYAPSIQATAPGSGQSDWIVAHSASTAAESPSSLLLDPGDAAISTNVREIAIPPGATRVWFRQSFLVSGANVSTLAIIYPWCGDTQGNWWRIDTTDQNGAGLTLGADTTEANNVVTTDGLTYLGDLVTLSGNDMLAGSVLRVLVQTASAHGSATQQVLCKFGN